MGEVMEDSMFRKKILFAVIISVLLMAGFTGCKKHVKAAVFTYEENDEGCVIITGLTDKGREDVKLTIPEKLDGRTVKGIGSGAFRDDVLFRISNYAKTIPRLKESHQRLITQ